MKRVPLDQDDDRIIGAKDTGCEWARNRFKRKVRCLECPAERCFYDASQIREVESKASKKGAA
jgi:hypothetical protein